MISNMTGMSFIQGYRGQVGPSPGTNIFSFFLSTLRKWEYILLHSILPRAPSPAGDRLKIANIHTMIVYIESRRLNVSLVYTVPALCPLGSLCNISMISYVNLQHAYNSHSQLYTQHTLTGYFILYINPTYTKPWSQIETCKKSYIIMYI